MLRVVFPFCPLFLIVFSAHSLRPLRCLKAIFSHVYSVPDIGCSCRFLREEYCGIFGGAAAGFSRVPASPALAHRAPAVCPCPPMLSADGCVSLQVFFDLWKTLSFPLQLTLACLLPLPDHGSRVPFSINLGFSLHFGQRSAFFPLRPRDPLPKSPFATRSICALYLRFVPSWFFTSRKAARSQKPWIFAAASRIGRS